MINIQLKDKVIKVSCMGKEYNFTDGNGEIEAQRILEFFNETSIELLDGEREYDIENEEVKSGIKLFIDSLFSKLSEEKKPNDAMDELVQHEV